MIGNIETILEPTVRLGVLLLFAALGEYVAERAGTINISLEGMMLTGAYGATLASSLAGSPVVGILAGMAAGLIIAFIQAQLSHRLDIDQFVVGIALTTLAVGLTTFLFIEVEMTSGRLHEFRIPGLAEIPIIGEAFFGQVWLTYLIVPTIFLVRWVMTRTSWGLELRAVGENPPAADVSGVRGGSSCARSARTRRLPTSAGCRCWRGARPSTCAACWRASRAPTWPSDWLAGSRST